MSRPSGDRLARAATAPWRWLATHRRSRSRPATPTGARHRIMIRALKVAAVAAALATAVGFWLSYTNLHTVAARAGLPPIEAWAFPASIDLFIVVGEMGILVSALRHRRDTVAWLYLLAGFAPSVVFNVLHVTVFPWWVPYVIAATAPTAAMLALAAFVRQVFRLVADYAETAGSVSPAVSPAVSVEAASNGEPPLPTFKELQGRRRVSQSTANIVRAEIRRDRAARAKANGHPREDVTA